jgi:hypothetical protein
MLAYRELWSQPIAVWAGYYTVTSDKNEKMRALICISAWHKKFCCDIQWFCIVIPLGYYFCCYLLFKVSQSNRFWNYYIRSCHWSCWLILTLFIQTFLGYVVIVRWEHRDNKGALNYLRTVASVRSTRRPALGAHPPLKSCHKHVHHTSPTPLKYMASS